MAISIDWLTKVINVQQSDLVPLGGAFYQLDLNSFRLALKNIEDSEEGMSFPTTHNHVAPVNIGGVSLGRVVEIINGYTVTFQDTGSPYAVTVAGGNSNVGDVVNLNGVSIRTANSAGLVEGSGGGGGLTTQQAQQLLELYRIHGLDPTLPLTVNPARRYVGTSVAPVIDQDIAESGSTVTVSRN